MPDPNQSPLLALAPELIQIIIDELSTDAIKDLRSTCKKLSEFLTPRLFRQLTINVTRTTLENEVFKLRTLATTDCHCAFSATRKLEIASLSPRYDPCNDLKVDGEYSSEVEAAEEQLKLYLFKAIASLKGVQSVIWEPHCKDGGWAQEVVMNALKTLPNLCVLVLHITSFQIPLPLDDLSGIQEISVIGRSNKYHARILDNFAKLVARSPKMTSIKVSIKARSFDSADRRHSLHKIFKYFPRDSPPQLRHLSLGTCHVKLDDVTLPHLQRLTSLSLMNVDDPPNSAHHNTHKSSRNDIWKALKISKIWLEELALDSVVPSFLDYLASYSGLKKLRLTTGGFHERSSPDSMATRFFSIPFTNHVQSLEDLGILATNEGSWCFGQSNLAVIARCTNLKALRMAIVFGQLSPRHVGAERDVMGRLIDTVTTFMPRIESICVSFAGDAGGFPLKCPVRGRSHNVKEPIILSIRGYRALPTCYRLPLLTVSGSVPWRNFVQGEPDKNGCLSYMGPT